MAYLNAIDACGYGFPGVDDVTDLTDSQLQFINEAWWRREQSRTPEIE